jgi:hypothetical protein
LPWAYSGDQQVVSNDTSLFRYGSGWNVQPGSGMYNLTGQIVMAYWTHNTMVDPNGNFMGRDDAGAAGMWTYSEDEIFRYYGAPLAAKGTSPVWTLYQSFNCLTGQTINYGIITPSQTLGITGTTTNNSANAGSVGEFIAGSAVSPGGSLTTNVVGNVTSIALTAGDWDVSGVADFTTAATTSLTLLQAGISVTSATFLTQTGGSGIGTDPLVIWQQAAAVPAAAVITLELPPVRVLLSAPATIYFVAKAVFTVSTMGIYGTVRARRMR